MFDFMCNLLILEIIKYYQIIQKKCNEIALNIGCINIFVRFAKKLRILIIIPLFEYPEQVLETYRKVIEFMVKMF